MSAQEVKSLDTPFEDLPRLDGKKPRIFRTITTIENSKITNTKIQEEIDETLYKQRINDLQGHLVEKDDNGNYYQTVRDKGSDTDFANIEIRKAFENVGPNSLTNQLQTGQIDSITRLFSEDQEGSKDTFWRSQLSGNDNVTEDPIETTEIATNFAIDKVEIKARRRKKYENLFYPEDIASSKQDKIRFTMFFQGGSRIGFDLNSSNPFKIGKKIQTNIEGSVTLPIQGGIADQNQVGYNNSTLNPVQGALGAIALNPQAAVQNLVDVFRGDTDIQAALRSQEATNTIAALRLYLAQTAVGASGLIPRTTGAILNPNLELILQSPTLRSFNFTFTMSARSRTEATQIKKIIRFFKQGMSVKKSKTSLFVASPNMFRINYLTETGTQHPSIGRIKDCALTAINTEYTPDGTYMTFDDEARTMTSYRINMQFTELEPITEDDYGIASGPVSNADDFFVTSGPPEDQIGF
tara:strand:+ start:284 stop:1684 length:1401 start_codon:yes stop_codon:yes gene_type:complete